MHLSPKAFGWATGLLLAVVWLVVMGFSLITGIGQTTITTLGGFHPYFSYAWGGLVVMIIEHLVGGYIVGWIFAKFYNRFAR